MHAAQQVLHFPRGVTDQQFIHLIAHASEPLLVFTENSKRRSDAAGDFISFIGEVIKPQNPDECECLLRLRTSWKPDTDNTDSTVGLLFEPQRRWLSFVVSSMDSPNECSIDVLYSSHPGQGMGSFLLGETVKFLRDKNNNPDITLISEPWAVEFYRKQPGWSQGGKLGGGKGRVMFHYTPK